MVVYTQYFARSLAMNLDTWSSGIMTLLRTPQLFWNVVVQEIYFD